MMDKLNIEDKIRIQTLREHGFGAKVIRASYPNKNWSLSVSTLQTICRGIDETGLAVTHRWGSGKSKSVLQQLVNILNTLIKYYVKWRQKSVQSLIHYSWKGATICSPEKVDFKVQTIVSVEPYQLL